MFKQLSHKKKDIIKFLNDNIKGYKILSGISESTYTHTDTQNTSTSTLSATKQQNDNKITIQFTTLKDAQNIATLYKLSYDPVFLSVTFKFNQFLDLIVPVIFHEYTFNTLSVKLIDESDINDSIHNEKWTSFKTLYRSKNKYDKKSQLLINSIITEYKKNPGKFLHYAEVLYHHDNILTLYPTFGYVVVNRKNVKYKLANFFEEIETLGSGTNGRVYSVKLLDPAIDVLIKKYPYINKKDTYVLKKLWSSSRDENMSKKCTKFTCDKIPRLLKELKVIDILTKELKCPHIIKTYGCFFYIDDINNLYTISILMENAGRYSLRKIIASNTLFNSISKADLFGGLIDLYSAMELLHLHKYYHKDIKLFNIVYSFETNKMKFVDFGAACNIIKFKCKDNGGTQAYNLPDIELSKYSHLNPNSYQEIIDRYAFGLCVYYLVLGACVTLDVIYVTEFNQKLGALPITVQVFIQKKIIPALKLNSVFEEL